ncbi:MAG TPA: DoxX family membrane protein [Candidatus Marinimicrobia bacterium]|nr:DoxX family membrane protein [Candidatus Neomarinimicrobiota bacterium]
MRQRDFHFYLRIVVRVILGFLFLYAALDKITNPQKFAEIIYNYRLLPIELLNLCAVIVPWLEAFIGLALLLGIWVETAALLLSGITVIFIILIISAILRGLDIECGCFSLDAAGSLVSWKRVAEDILILAGGIYLFSIQK